MATREEELRRRLAKEARNVKWLKRGIWVAIVATVLIAIVQVPMAIMRFVPPFRIVESEIETDPVRAGDNLRIRYEVKRSRACRMKVQRFIYLKGNGLVVHRDVQPGGLTDPGETREVRIEIPIPLATPPGRYALDVSLTNFCPEGEHTLHTKGLEFDVVQ